jgi:hypothetical protein
MRAGSGLLSLLARLASGRLQHEFGTYARREARLAAIAVAGFVAFLTFLLGAAAITITMFYTMLAPRFGALGSLAILIGVALAVALASLLVAIRAAKAFARWQGIRERLPKPQPASIRRRSYDDDALVAVLISALFEQLMSSSRRAR